MPANEFEKRVQEKMEELKLSPSGEVWMEVERRIKKEKKKRRFLIWFIFLFMVLGGATVTALWVSKNNKNQIILSNEKDRKTSPVNPSFKNQQENKAIRSTDSNSETTIIKKRALKYEIDKSNGHEVNATVVDNSKNLLLKKTKQNENINHEPIQNNEREIKNEIAKNNLTDVENNLQEVQKKDTSQAKNIQAADTISLKGIAFKNENNKQVIPYPFVANKDSFVVSRQNLQKTLRVNSDSIESNKQDSLESLTENKKDSTAVTASRKKSSMQDRKTKTWEWGLILQKGRSNIVNGIKFSDKSLYADALSSPNSSSPGTPQYYYASPVYSASSFAAGVQVKRSVAKRVDINLGLKYSYLSTKMNVGNRIDSSFTFFSYGSSAAGSNFYRVSASGVQSYKNQFHFVNLSAELAWKFINAKKIQVYWNNELSYDRLFSSNALRFDKSLPGYYKDFGSLSHNDIFFSTGFSVPVFQKFEINPFAAWSLTHVWRNTNAAKANFSNYGIRIKILLNKK